jgi:(p)ppGpp synthase/HD superfamily hydrolase
MTEEPTIYNGKAQAMHSERNRKMSGRQDSDGIHRAIAFATKAHVGQLRKGTDVPYVTHPVSVGTLLARAGCADDLIMAGILHDCLEDTETTFGQLKVEFNETVAELVRDCSEKDRSGSWIERKEATVKKLKDVSDEACLVACADKTHNLWSMIRDFRQLGEALWERFNATRESQIWYFKSLGIVFSERHEQHPLFADYQEHLKTFLNLVEKESHDF